MAKAVTEVTKQTISILKKNKMYKQPPAVKKPTEYKTVASYNEALDNYNVWAKEMNAAAKDLLTLASEEKKAKGGVAGIVKRVKKRAN